MLFFKISLFIFSEFLIFSRANQICKNVDSYCGQYLERCLDQTTKEGEECSSMQEQLGNSDKTCGDTKPEDFAENCQYSSRRTKNTFGFNIQKDLVDCFLEICVFTQNEKVDNLILESNDKQENNLRFLTFTPWGRWTNRLIEIEKAATIAVETNRILVLVDYEGENPSKFLDLADLSLRMLQLSFNNSFVCYQTDYEVVFNRSISDSSVEVNIGLRTGAEIFEKLKKIANQVVLIEGAQIFHFRAEKSKAYLKLRPTYNHALQENVWKYLDENRVSTLKRVHVNPSLGLHIRREDVSKNFDLNNYLNFAKNLALQQEAFYVYIGTNAIDQETNIIRTAFPMANFGFASKCMTNLECIVVDQIVMASLDRFIGSPYSTFSCQVMRMRSMIFGEDSIPKSVLFEPENNDCSQIYI